MSDIVRIQSELSNFGISLHQRTVEVLIGEIEQAIADGRIRSKNGKHSIFNFIRVILNQKSEYESWKRFVSQDPDTLTFCEGVKFDRKDGKLANTESPATDLFGLVYIAYMSSGEYSQQLRRSSASYFVKSRKTPNVSECHAGENEGVINPHNVQLEDKIAELTDLLADWQAKYKQVYDKMQYHQARAMGAEMLDRLKTKPDSFSEDCETLWIIAGTHDKYYFVSRCREDLEYGVDYINGNRKGQIKLTPHAALQMMLNLRTKRGVQARYLPQKAEIQIQKVVGKEASKMNRRKLQDS